MKNNKIIGLAALIIILIGGAIFYFNSDKSDATEESSGASSETPINLEVQDPITLFEDYLQLAVENKPSLMIEMATERVDSFNLQVLLDQIGGKSLIDLDITEGTTGTYWANFYVAKDYDLEQVICYSTFTVEDGVRKLNSLKVNITSLDTLALYISEHSDMKFIAQGLMDNYLMIQTLSEGNPNQISAYEISSLDIFEEANGLIRFNVSYDLKPLEAGSPYEKMGTLQEDGWVRGINKKATILTDGLSYYLVHLEG